MTTKELRKYFRCNENFLCTFTIYIHPTYEFHITSHNFNTIFPSYLAKWFHFHPFSKAYDTRSYKKKRRKCKFALFMSSFERQKHWEKKHQHIFDFYTTIWDKKRRKNVFNLFFNLFSYHTRSSFLGCRRVGKVGPDISSQVGEKKRRQKID